MAAATGRARPFARLTVLALLLALACAAGACAARGVPAHGARLLLADEPAAPTVMVVLHTPKAGGSTLTMLFKRLDALGVVAYTTHVCPGWEAVVDAAVSACGQAGLREAPLRMAYEVHRTAALSSPTLAELEAGVKRMRAAGVRVFVAGLFRDPLRFFWSNYWDGHRHSWLKPLTDARKLCDALAGQKPGTPAPTHICDKAPWEWSPADPQAKQLAIWASEAQGSAKMPSAAQLLAAVERVDRGDSGGGGADEFDLLAALTERRYEGPTLRLARRVLDLIDVPIPVERQNEGVLALVSLAGLSMDDVSVPIVNAHHFGQGGEGEAHAFEERAHHEGRLDGYFELDTQLVAEANAKLNAVSVSLGADFVHSLDAYREHERSPHGWQSKHAGGMWWQGGLPRAPRYEVCYVGPLARKGGAQLAASAGYPAYESIGSDDALKGHFPCAPRRPCSCEQPSGGGRGSHAPTLEAALCVCASAREPCNKLTKEAFRLPLG